MDADVRHLVLDEGYYVAYLDWGSFVGMSLLLTLKIPWDIILTVLLIII